jgi:tol-pal system protein YbgF
LAERLKQLEDSQAQLRADLDLVEAQLGTRSPDAARPADRPADRSTAPTGSGSDVSQVYAQAQADYNARQYERAMRLFSRVIEVGPTTDLADNAQYWIGECYWGLGQYREALDAFAAVLRFPGTDKADDAQLKIGRCYAALGQRAKAEEALRTLLSDYPDSEYADAARRELAKLGKP